MAESRGRGFLFNEVEIKTPGRSGFDMSFENRLSFNMGDLIPVSCQECLPGDSFGGNPQFFARFAPMLAPIMHKVDLFHYTFFVPNRLLWSSWQDFISPGDGKKTMKSLSDGSYVAPEIPNFNTKDVAAQLGYSFVSAGSLMDYLGVQMPLNPQGYPFLVNGTTISDDNQSHLSSAKICSLPFRAYQLVWDEYFRDQNVTASLDVPLTDGSENTSDYAKLFTIRRKAWEHDYFTSALPEPQRGPDVYLPLGDSAPLKFDGSQNGNTFRDSNGNLILTTGSGTVSLNMTQTTSGLPTKMTTAGGSSGIRVNENDYKVDLTAATSATINTLRQAFRLQEFLEKSARVGGRYIESILAHFGVNVPDSRLQRPEFVSAGRVPVQVSATTADAASNVTDGTTTWLNVQGTQTGNAMSSGSDKWSYTCLEHGFLITLVCVLPRTAYMQGLKRMYMRSNYLDFAWPSFAHLGEQEVYSRELWNSSSISSDDVFGYQSRYAEYKYNADEIHGDFRTSLKFWHLGRDLGYQSSSRPLLNESFIFSDPSSRIFAVTDSSVHHIYLDVWYDLYKESALPLYGTPTL